MFVATVTFTDPDEPRHHTNGYLSEYACHLEAAALTRRPATNYGTRSPTRSSRPSP